MQLCSGGFDELEIWEKHALKKSLNLIPMKLKGTGKQPRRGA
jgi:hypothetical protein